MNDSKEKGFNLDLSSDVARGVYSNLVIISHSPSEMVLDFSQILPGSENPIVRERVIMSPIHAKRLLSALGENIQKYEDKFGVIVEPDANDKSITIPYDIKSMGKA